MQLSIVTVCYNEKDIGRTCESIVSQSCQDFEWIVVDGGSTDGSLEVIKHYKERIDILISEPDNGIYDAMNKGIRKSTGELIGIINSDDIYEKDTNGQIIRYIEVKTLTGQWGQGGVGITEHQLEFAQKEKDKWWLFVVENINTDNIRVYQFKNPILEANRFMFDNSWKQLAYQADSVENREPKINDMYEIEIQGIMTKCVVTTVKQRGVFFQVDLILENEKVINKKRFDKSWRKIDG